jgi:hypothetical protein
MVSPVTGLRHFKEWGKLTPRFIGMLNILEKRGKVQGSMESSHRNISYLGERRRIKGRILIFLFRSIRISRVRFILRRVGLQHPVFLRNKNLGIQIYVAFMSLRNSFVLMWCFSFIFVNRIIRNLNVCLVFKSVWKITKEKMNLCWKMALGQHWCEPTPGRWPSPQR